MHDQFYVDFPHLSSVKDNFYIQDGQFLNLVLPLFIDFFF